MYLLGSGSVLLALSLLKCISALDNGLIRTPPMGWLSWERFRCTVDCTTYPNDCINENLFKTMADRVAADGYKDAGYEYILMDDCWLAKNRDSKGRLQPDPDRFPNGIKSLADYIHSKGLKYGLYEDVGAKTCAGYPGSEFYFQLDAQTFADWEVDYLKFDGCNYSPDQYQFGYPPMAFFLNMTGRPIALSCEYALYQRSHTKPDYKGQAAACNVARNNDDIDDSWDSLKGIIEYYGNNDGDFASVAGPGYFNDPDMLLIGNFGLSYDQERVQMAVWSILAAPLIMSNDLRNIRPESKALLLNRAAISVNQDPLGIQGRLIKKIGNVEVWAKPIQPTGSYAFAFVNMNTAVPTHVSVTFEDIVGFRGNGVNGFNVTEIFDGKYMGIFKPHDTFATYVNPTGVFFAKAIAV